MSSFDSGRRRFLSRLAAGLGGGLAAIPVWDGVAGAQQAPVDEKPRHKVERLGVGAIGLRYQGSVITHKA
jgi:myo-inositol 2-dehydrogenase / D-chiro-inositol 1-dehydrogenase